jgi:hypothetical protein
MGTDASMRKSLSALFADPRSGWRHVFVPSQGIAGPLGEHRPLISCPGAARNRSRKGLNPPH